MENFDEIVFLDSEIVEDDEQAPVGTLLNGDKHAPEAHHVEEAALEPVEEKELETAEESEPEHEEAPAQPEASEETPAEETAEERPSEEPVEELAEEPTEELAEERPAEEPAEEPADLPAAAEETHEEPVQPEPQTYEEQPEPQPEAPPAYKDEDEEPAADVYTQPRLAKTTQNKPTSTVAADSIWALATIKPAKKSKPAEEPKPEAKEEAKPAKKAPAKKAAPAEEQKPEAKEEAKPAKKAPAKKSAPAEEQKSTTKEEAKPAKKETISEESADKKQPQKKAPTKKAAPAEDKTAKKPANKPANVKDPKPASAKKTTPAPTAENDDTDKKTPVKKEDKKVSNDEEKVLIEADETKPQHGKFVIKKTDKGNFVYKLYSSNKRVLAVPGGAYKDLTACKGGIQSVINNAATAPIEDQTLKKPVEQKCPKWEIYLDNKNEFRLRLIASNGNVVAITNDGYLGKDAAKKGIDAIARAAAGASVVRNDDLW